VVLGSLLRIPVGVLTDRLGGRVMFPIVLAVSALPAAAFGFVEGYAALIVVGFFLGIAGSSFAVGVPFVAGWYAKERQGFALGVYGMGNIGTAVAAFGAPAIVEGLGREALGIVAAALLLATAGLFYRLAEDPPRGGAPARYGDMLRSGWKLWRLALLYFVTFGGFVAMAVFLPKLLRDWFDISLTDAGLRAAGFTVIATFARPVGGWLSDRIGPATVLIVVFIGAGLDATWLALVSGDPTWVPVTIACLTLAAFLGLGNGAVFKAVPRDFPQATGAATGIVGAAGGLGGFFPPVVMGIVKDHFDTYALGFVGLLVFTVVCLVVALTMHRAARAPQEVAA
jgi:NNP family nitrate/nitrite transporter-like MFS transporter